MTPHQYLKELKDLMELEKAKLQSQKQDMIELKEFEMAALYRDIEQKLLEFIEKLKL
jgi:protein-arginine kinase activator protein McsA